METIQVNRCVHCMADLSGDGDVCPRCGKNPLVAEQPVYCLRPFSILRGKYMVGRMLGRGGFGITYVGWDLTLEAKVAVKECYPGSLAVRDSSVSNHLQWDTSLARDGQWRASCESFLREARKMAKVRDIPEVVRVLDTFEENNTAYIVMDFVEGITLKQWLERRGTASPDGCVELLRPLMNALSRIHRQGIIHRDISPDNIMIEPDGSLKLLDLGAAKELAPQHSHHSLLVTKSGFSPVEQYAENGQIGPWTDVYALCATLYYCMTGKTVPPALDRLDDPSPLEFRREDFKEPLRPELEAALRNGLALRAAERTQSVDELLRQLESGAKQEPGPKPKPKGRGKLIAAAVLVPLILLVSAIGLLTNRDTGDDTPGPNTEADAGEEQISPPDELKTSESLPVLERTIGPTIAAGYHHTACLRTDGTAVAVGQNTYGECDVGTWADIVAIAAGNNHTVGLRSDGTVVAVGSNEYGQCNVDGWTDIVAIDAETARTVGLKSDGTVVVTGEMVIAGTSVLVYGEGNIDSWTDIVEISCGWYHTVGLKSDGTVVIDGEITYGEGNVGGWTDIVAVSAGRWLTTGLKSDGTVVSTGWNGGGECDVDSWSGIVAISCGCYHTVGLCADGTAVATGSNAGGQCEVGGWTDVVAIAGGAGHTIGLKADGTLVTAGGQYDYACGQCNVAGWTDILIPDLSNQIEVEAKPMEDESVKALTWTDIVSINAGFAHTVGVKSNGTVVAVGDNEYGQCNVNSWTDIVAVACGNYWTVGLRADRTVVAVGMDDDGQCDVAGWSDIVAVACGGSYTVGLRSNGTVVAAGEDGSVKDGVDSWSDIVAIACGTLHTAGLKSDGTVAAVGLGANQFRDLAGIESIAGGGFHTAGLKPDGTVVAAGPNDFGKCNVDNWTDIVAIACGYDHTVGLKSDGTVVAVGSTQDGRCNVSSWTDIVAVACGYHHTVGLKADGTVVAVGYNKYGQCGVAG